MVYGKTTMPWNWATPEAFARDPKLVWEWYNWRRELIAGCKPNPAHEMLVAIENSVNEFLLVTQNVDGLHRIAGSRNVVEIHGNIWRVRCTKEGKVSGKHAGSPLILYLRCVNAEQCSVPHIVWFW